MSDAKPTDTAADKLGPIREYALLSARSHYVTEMPERTPKDYAIEFGEYLAKAAERYRDLMNVEDLEAIHPDDSRDAFSALNEAIYEFRKRAARART